MRTCNSCGDLLEVGENWALSRAKTSHPHCNECARKAIRKKRRDRKLEAIEYLGGKCSECGGTFHIASYDFHHIDPNTKDFKPSDLFARSKELLYKELDKCVLLCANCHRVHHYTE